ncbi:MAG: response regulator transcription factor [Flavobacteriales bacterium]|nr:response regulator transcription factor [Flavobacteriales bacterium]
MIKIAIVDENRLFRKSIETLLNSYDNMKVIFDTQDGNDLHEKLIESNIDVLLIDIQLNKMNGIALVESLRTKFPKIRIFIITQINTKEIILKMIEIGMDGFFSKNTEPMQLKNAISAMDSSCFHYDSDLEIMIKETLLWEKRNQTKIKYSFTSITKREMEVIKLACQEYNSIEIADILNINVRTVETHRKRLIEKTNTKNFIGVVLYALKNRLLTIEGF